VTPYEPSEYDRVFNDARKAQGFLSQAHLDAFFAHYDHMRKCNDCNALDGFVLLDDGKQPYMGECAIAKRLYLAYLEIR